MSCHVLHRDTIKTAPFNVTIIFHADPTTILCNLKAAARSATLFPKVFKLPTE